MAMKQIDFDPVLKELGEKGETKAVKILKHGLKFILSRPDYTGHRKIDSWLYGEELQAGEDVEFEIKTKSEPFEPPPFYGNGTDIYQIKKRMRRYKKYGIKQFLLVIQKDKKVYGQWLHILEAGEKKDTRKGIRIYPLDNFEEIPEFIWKE